ncbi:hypothetical protein [Synechococcus sp. PCC 6312]|uniref:hypothetical protein n=1 Tax=Synechococcus sp. (strain ATCC 27167 / PCC 6312) TaxID=195253 RepID=UPI00029F0A29|nr:hypothetical protein [Synechococcus sp. PCC 6312]AFY62275.1 hypothetical protein Syn6312_3229 [Synechococcus sp. PCC 6312]
MSNSPPVPPKTAWISRVWTTAQPILVQESIVILQSVMKGGAILLSRLETRSGQLQLPAPSPESSYLLKAQPWFQTLGAKWWQLMSWLRGKLPPAWQAKLTEMGLTIIFMGVLLIFLWSGPSQAPATSPASKTRPSPTLSPPPSQTTVLVKPRPAPTPYLPVPSPSSPPELAPTSESMDSTDTQEVNLRPVAAPETRDDQISEIPAESVLPTALGDVAVPAESLPPIEAELGASKSPAEIEDIPVVPMLSPEEAALADARNQFLGITNQYQPGLVEDLALDQNTGAARFTLNPAWYALTSQAQDGLAQDLWQRSHQLEFSQVLITDTSGRMLVRSPIIGQKPVIVHRVASVP